MKLQSTIMVGSFSLLLLGACSPSSYQTTFPEPAYVKVSTNNKDYVPYPTNPVAEQELMYWSESLTEPMTIVTNLEPAPLLMKGPGPVILDSPHFSARLYRDKTDVKKKDKNGNWVSMTRVSTPADQRMKNFIIHSRRVQQ